MNVMANDGLDVGTLAFILLPYPCWEDAFHVGGLSKLSESDDLPP